MPRGVNFTESEPILARVFSHIASLADPGAKTAAIMALQQSSGLIHDEPLALTGQCGRYRSP